MAYLHISRPCSCLDGGWADTCVACSTLEYLQHVATQLPDATAQAGGLRPTELRAPSGCIAELNTNYKGAQ